MVSVPASLVFVCGAIRTETGLVVLALFTLPPLILMLGRALSGLIRDRLLRRQLAARIQRAGLLDADPRDPQRAELERAAELATLAGGLTLAEHELDDTLRGALSGDTAQQGQLEAVSD